MYARQPAATSASRNCTTRASSVGTNSDAASCALNMICGDAGWARDARLVAGRSGAEREQSGGLRRRMDQRVARIEAEWSWLERHAAVERQWSGEIVVRRGAESMNGSVRNIMERGACQVEFAGHGAADLHQTLQVAIRVVNALQHDVFEEHAVLPEAGLPIMPLCHSSRAWRRRRHGGGLALRKDHVAR